MPPDDLPPFVDKNRDKAVSSADILAEYSAFEGIIQALMDELPKRWRSAPNVIGVGRHAIIFSLGSDKELVARVLHQDTDLDTSADHIKEKVEVGALSRGIPHLEQIIAASPEDNVVIYEKAPGIDMFNQPSESLQRITDEQIFELIDVGIIASEKGIVFDPASANLMYDPEFGFTVIDLQLQLVDDYEHPLQAVVDMLNASAIHTKELGEGHKFLDAQNIHESIELMTRFSHLIQTKIRDEALLHMLQHGAQMNILANQAVLESRKQPKGIGKIRKLAGEALDRITGQKP